MEQQNKMFRVYSRFRPLNARERNECADETILVRNACTEKRVVVTGTLTENNTTNTSSSSQPNVPTFHSPYDQNNSMDFSFNLDHVHYEDTTQQQLYETSIAQHVHFFLETTQDVNILTYGQTSSGKTWTTDGDFYSRAEKTLWLDEQQLSLDKGMGILPRILYTLCKTYKSEIRVSYYEIYCEKVYDLLSFDDEKNEPKECKFTEANGQISTGVSRYSCMNVIDADAIATANNCYRQICLLLRKSNKNRHFGFTAMNSKSSRSHTFLEFHCPTTRRKTINKGQGRGGSLSRRPDMSGPCEKTLRIIDLAGSERSAKTLAKDKTLTEGININNSLMYLKQMIEIIANQNNRRSQTLPKFRESKLTRIIHSSINGNQARIVLLLCCSPSTFNYNETLNTLRFGSTAIKIERESVGVKESENIGNMLVDQMIGLHGESLERHNEELVRNERAKALQQLRTLENTMTAAKEEERRGFEHKIENYERQIRELRDAIDKQTVSLKTYEKCKETIELQRKIINELTNEKMQMRNELNVYQLFREYMIASFDDNDNDADADNDNVMIDGGDGAGSFYAQEHDNESYVNGRSQRPQFGSAMRLINRYRTSS